MLPLRYAVTPPPPIATWKANLGAELALDVIAGDGDHLVAETFAADGHELTDAAVHGGKDAGGQDDRLLLLNV